MDYEAFLRRIGHRIQEARKVAGLTQEDMACYNFNVRHYQDIEAGKVNFTLGTLYRIARALKVPPENLVSMD